MPYGISASGIVKAVNELYAYLHAINQASIHYRYDRLEELLQPAAFSGLISEVMVRALAEQLNTATPGLTRNLYPNGHPDLIPRALYPDDRVHYGTEGVEIKAARNPNSIQAHNVNSGWIAVVEFSCDVVKLPTYDREPTIVHRVRIAKLQEDDWSFSGRGEGSRRTPTASILESGRARLDTGTVYIRGGPQAYADYMREASLLRRRRREARTPREDHRPPP